MRFSERSDRTSPTIRVDALGQPSERESVARTFTDLDVDRIAIAPSRALIHLALQHVLTDPGDELLVLPSADAIASEAAIVAGIEATPIDEDGASIFEAAGERTRAIVVGSVDAELVEMLAELDLPIITSDAAIAKHPIFASENAPLVAVIGQSASFAWLALAGPADRAEPLMTRLEWLAPVLFARVG